MLSTVPLLPNHLISICWNIPKREITSYFSTSLGQQTRKVVLLQLSGILPLHATSTSSSSQLDLATSTWGRPGEPGHPKVCSMSPTSASLGLTRFGAFWEHG